MKTLRQSLLTISLGLVLSVSAWAGHPNQVQMNQVKNLSQSLMVSSGNFYHHAEGQIDTTDALELQALAAAKSFKLSADEFYSSVLRNMSVPKYTELDYQRLTSAFQQLSLKRDALADHSNLNVIFNQVSGTVTQLSRFYSATNASDWDLVRVRQLARDISRRAFQVRTSAEREAYYGHDFEKRAVWDLKYFENAAVNFEQRMNFNWDSPEHTRADFERLRNAYQYATTSLSLAHFSGFVEWEFERIKPVLMETQSYY